MYYCIKCINYFLSKQFITIYVLLIISSFQIIFSSMFSGSFVLNLTANMFSALFMPALYRGSIFEKELSTKKREDIMWKQLLYLPLRYIGIKSAIYNKR